MRFGSACSGIEAASKAWEPLGWDPQWYSEVEKFPSAVLNHHYPNVPNLGDMTKLNQSEVFNERTIDLLVGGTPCQSFSVAGLRKGMADPRGNLALVFLSILARKLPRWVVWENVPGVLSSGGGRDFGSFLGALGKIGYGWSYRILDAQYFGVPQRRRRVFVVGHLGDWRRSAAVLFERSCLSGNPPPSREKREGTAGDVAGCPRSGGDGGVPSSRGEHLIPEVAGCLQERDAKGCDSDTKPRHLIPVCFEPGVMPRDGGHVYKDIAGTLRKEPGDNAQCVCFEPRSPDGHARVTGDVSPTLNRMGGGQREPCIAQVDWRTANADNGEVAQTLKTDLAHQSGPCIAIQDGREIQKNQNGLGISQEGTAYTLDQLGAQAVATPNNLYSMMPMNSGKDFKARQVDVTQPIMAAGQTHGNQGGDVIQSGMSVRRLTPRECERLQGFPDDYTLIPIRPVPAKGQEKARILAKNGDERFREINGVMYVVSADGPRYKALGNSMAVPVMAWIGRRIQMVEQCLE